MNGRPRYTVLPLLPCALVLLVGCAATVLADEGPDRLPGELKIFLSPGTGDGKTIIFRTTGDEPPPSPAPGTVVPRQEVPAAAATAGYQSSASLRSGYRQDRLNWSIAAPGGSPNILSELTWDRLDIAEVAGDVRWSDSSKLYLRGGANFGWITGRQCRDSDYYGDNRTLEFSRSYSKAGGSVWDATLGAGYRFDLPLTRDGGRLHLMPLAGYSAHAQDVQMTDGEQVVSDFGFTMPLGPFPGLNSSYDALWHGPWLGLDMELTSGKRHTLLASFEYHWVNYKAEADWNLRGDFQHPVSYRHTADGEGIVASLGYRYRPAPDWSVQVQADYRDMGTDPGEDVTYLADGRSGTIRLNRVEWQSWSASFGITYNF